MDETALIIRAQMRTFGRAGSSRAHSSGHLSPYSKRRANKRSGPIRGGDAAAARLAQKETGQKAPQRET
jgi:hypothetical protein